MEPTVCLSPLETAIGMPIGSPPAPRPLPDCANVSPLEALEAAVLPALLQPPCMVEFSGGRDSSAVLAVATRVARREGLPLPIPSTNLFPGLPEAQESRWQELVMRHLGLEDWCRRSFDGELELLGPVAKKVMQRHGLLAPASAYNAMPALEDAAGGTSVTGVDGDGLLDGWASQRAWDVMCRRVPARPRDVLRIGKAGLPASLRRPWFRFRTSLDIEWLQPRAKKAVDRAWADWWAHEPTVWRQRVPWWTQSRLITASLEAIDLLAQDAGTVVVHPLLDAKFLAALARAGGRSGFGTRTRAMHQLFGGLLPPEVLSRTDKADFTFGYWGEESRRFAGEWNGEGLPAELVDVDALRTLWKSGVPDMRSALLLQAAWLATSGSIDAEKSFNCRLK